MDDKDFEKNIDDGKEKSLSIDDAATAEAPACPGVETLSVNEEAAAEDTPQTEVLPEAAPIAPDWRFGDGASAPTAEKHPRGGLRFGIAFGAVIGVCILLLVLTLWLGENGLHIVRTVFTDRTVFVREYDSESGLLTPEEAAHVMRQSTVSVVIRTEAGKSGIGSGFVYSADGHICTNYHVIDGAVLVQVVLPDGEVRDATVVGYDTAADLAVLKIDAAGLVPATLGSSADLLVGEQVMAIGSPAKLDYAGTATFGKVSEPSRLITMFDDTGAVQKKMTLIQTDTSVNPGNSGGPLADMYGRVVGVVVMKIKTIAGTTFENMGFAIPIDDAKIIVDAIIAKGSFTGKNPVAEGASLIGISGRGLMAGVWYNDPAADKPVSSTTAQEGYFKMPCNGVYVLAVTGENSAGRLQVGDIITEVNGLAAYTVNDVTAAVNRHYAGETVVLTVMRAAGDGYTEIAVEIVLTQGPLGGAANS